MEPRPLLHSSVSQIILFVLCRQITTFYPLRQLEAELDEATRHRSVSPSPSLPIVGSPESVGSRSNSVSVSSASPKLAPSDPVSGGEAEPSMEWAEPSGEKCMECEWGGVKYAVGEMVYVRPR